MKKPRTFRLQVGDKVRYYSAMRPRRDLVGEAVIKRIAPQHEQGDDMIWMDGVVGCYHPDAVERNIDGLDG